MNQYLKLTLLVIMFCNLTATDLDKTRKCIFAKRFAKIFTNKWRLLSVPLKPVNMANLEKVNVSIKIKIFFFINFIEPRCIKYDVQLANKSLY